MGVPTLRQVLPPELIRDILENKIGRLSASRVGVIVNINTRDFLANLPGFVNSRLLAWLVLGDGVRSLLMLRILVMI